MPTVELQKSVPPLKRLIIMVISLNRAQETNFLFVQVVYLENINLILAFIVNIISQPVEHLNISSAYIVCSNTEMHVLLYTTVNVYTAISYPIGYLSGSVDRIREFITFIF